MRAQFEKVEYRDDSSWRLLIRELETIPFEWHFHPEYELTLTLNSAGERYIGDNISDYHHADLTLVGPNIPHTWQSQHHLDPTRPQKVYVLWFDQAWVDNLLRSFPEFSPLDTLFKQLATVWPFQTCSRLRCCQCLSSWTWPLRRGVPRCC